MNEEKYYVKTLCPDPITVPIGVECVWRLISPKLSSVRSRTKYIAVAAIYYRGPKSTKKKELFDHIAETFHFLSSKYGSAIHFIIAGDTNRLNLTPITNLSPNLMQLVKVPTRLNPDRILDPIISTLGKWYNAPITKPQINANQGCGKPSDHLVVIMRPLASTLEVPPRVYTTVVTRPLTQSGFSKFSEWVENQTWSEVYESKNGHEKAELFQEIVFKNFERCFPTKSMKVCAEDKPWISPELKKLDRAVKREFYKNKNSQKWETLYKDFVARCTLEKEKYYEKMVSDLKISNPGRWYSKVKRMTGQENTNKGKSIVDELTGLSDE